MEKEKVISLDQVRAEKDKEKFTQFLLKAPDEALHTVFVDIVYKYVNDEQKMREYIEDVGTQHIDEVSLIDVVFYYGEDIVNELWNGLMIKCFGKIKKNLELTPPTQQLYYKLLPVFVECHDIQDTQMKKIIKKLKRKYQQP